MKKHYYIFLLSLLCINCNSINTQENFDSIYTAVIEIPAGTNKKFEYNYQSKVFECECKLSIFLFLIRLSELEKL